MKKRAFTLAEALIALGVVGVVAALMLPMANKSRPDAQRFAYLRTYDSLSHAVKDISSASKLYNPVLNVDDLDNIYNIQDYPLLDTYTEKKINGVDCGSGTAAFGKLLKVVYKGEDAGDGWFVTKDGKEFLVKSSADGHVLKDSSTGAISLYYTITVDLNGKEGVNAFYDKNKSNVIPDRFKFFVLPNGSIVPADVYGQMYISTRKVWRKQSEEQILENIAKEKEITEEDLKNSEGPLKTEISLSELNVVKKNEVDDTNDEVSGGTTGGDDGDDEVSGGTSGGDDGDDEVSAGTSGGDDGDDEVSAGTGSDSGSVSGGDNNMRDQISGDASGGYTSQPNSGSSSSGSVDPCEGQSDDDLVSIGKGQCQSGGWYGYN